MATVSRAMGAVDWAQIVLLSVVWGGSYFFVAIAVKEVHPFVIVFSRVAIGAAILILVARLSGLRMPPTLAWWWPLAVMAILNNVFPWILITWGQTQIGSGLAAIFNAATPLFTVLIANFFTQDELLTPGKLAGVVLGLLGVLVLVGQGILSELGTGTLAEIAVLVASVSYAISGVFARRLHDRPPVALAAGQMACSTLLMLPLLVMFAPPWTQPMPGLAPIAAILCLGLFSTAFGYLLVFRVLRSAGATNFSLVTFLLPVTAIVLGAVFLDERLEPRAFAGMALIGLGLAAIDGRPGRAIMRLLR
jgi:drug/metabolite transporter (DMT)-like permease